MSRTPRQLGRCWIALAAFCAAMTWGSASVSACEAMQARSGVACATACACCKAAPAAERPRRTAAGTTLRAEIRPAVLAQARVCGIAPAEDCGCRPAPAEAPPADGRRPVEVARPHLLLMSLLAPVVPPTAPASIGPIRRPRGGLPTGPALYLLNARFLI